MSNRVALENDKSRVDIHQKVTGKARYTADQYPRNLLYAKFVRSPFGNATLAAANVDAARAVRGIVEVEVNIGGEAPYPGARVGHIAGESRNAIRDALRALAPRWESADSVTDSHIDMSKESAPPATNTEDDQKLDEIYGRAAAIRELIFQTQVQTHSCLEPHGGVVDHRGDSAEVWGSTQGTSAYLDGIRGPCDLPANQITVRNEYVGGGFGSKFGPDAEGTLAARLSKKFSRPCKVMLDRDEEHLDAGNRPGSVQYMKLAVAEDGRILGGRIHCASIVGFQRGGGGVRNPQDALYRFGDVVRTESEINVNFARPRAFRAPGYPQATFAIEGMMDELAAAVGMDPVAFRLVNEASDRRRKQLAIGARLIGWENRQPDGTAPGRIKRGLGVAGAFWPTWRTACEAEVEVSRDGSVVVRSGVQDIGTGTMTLVTDVACHELGLDRSKVTGRVGNSSYPPGPDSGGSVVSRSVSPAVVAACANVVEQLKQIAAREWNVNANAVSFEKGTFTAGNRSASWSEVCAVMSDNRLVGRGKTETGQEGDGTSDCVQFAEVDVDTETGIVRVVKIVAVHAGGVVVNRLTFENQVYGGVIQGISYALFEGRRLDRRTGSMLNADFIHYKIAGSKDIPEIVAVLDVEGGDTGVRPIGEPATIPTAGAIANAVSNAIGARVTKLPITPQSVLELLDSRSAQS